MRHDIPTIATEMRKAGYTPLLFGYTDTSADPRMHDPNDPILRSYEQPMAGFEEAVEMRLEESYPWRSHLMKQGYSFDNYWDVYVPTSSSGGRAQLNDPAIYTAKDSDTAFLTDSFLGTMAPLVGQKWFAHLTYIRPHPPLVAPAPYNKMYDPKSLPLPVGLEAASSEAALHPFFAPTLQEQTATDIVQGFEDVDPTPENIQTLRSVYLGLATEVDHHIGRVVQFLKDSGQYDETLLIITADHGEMLGDRHSWGKMTVYDAAYHTPLLIRLPGNQERAGAVISAPTESIDVTPTILDWIGQPVPNSMDGRSLLPLLRGVQPKDWRCYSFSELDFSEPLVPTIWQQHLGTGPGDSSLGILRDERFTLVEFAADLPPMLFDHEGRGEFENVASNPDHMVDLARLTRQMLRHRMRNMDQTLSLHTITSDGPKSRSRH